MPETPVNRSLERIEAALARLESAARTVSSEARQGRDTTSELASRHERLKAAVGQSLAQLDELIAGRTS